MTQGHEMIYVDQNSRSTVFPPWRTIIIYDSSLINLITGGNLKCPKKHVKDIFSRDFICIKFWNAQKSNTFGFSLFCSKSHHVSKFWNAQFFYVRKFWNAQFSTKNESKIGSIFGHFKILCIWNHVRNISFTCFLEHFKLPPVLTIMYDR